MLRFLLPYFGFDTTTLPEGASVSFYFKNAPESWVAFVLLLMAVLLLFFLWKVIQSEHPICPPRIRKRLGALRCLVVALLFVIFLDPSLQISEKKIVDAHTLFLLDNSASMSVSDIYLSDISRKNVQPYLNTKEQGAKRLSLLLAAFEQNQTSLLSKSNLHFFTFGRELNEEIQVSHLYDAVQIMTADQSGTDLVRSMKDAVNLFNGKKISSIVLVSDGVSNTGAPLVDAQSFLASQKIPVYCLGIGNTEKNGNAYISEMWVPQKVFKEDPFFINVKVGASQLEGSTAEIQLVEVPLNEEEEEIASQAVEIGKRSILFTSNDFQSTISFEHTTKKEGKYAYYAKITSAKQETILTDNVKDVSLETLTKSAKVLLIGGTASWDYRMLQTLLIRDKTIDVSCWLQSMDEDMMQEGNTIIEKLPDTEEGLFMYDVVMMMDPNFAEIDEKWISLLQNFVENKKGGVMYIAGPVYTLKTLSLLNTQKMRELLPVFYSDMSADDKNLLKVVFDSQWSYHLTIEGKNHYLGKLIDDYETNVQLWKVLPGLYWSFPVSGAKPGAKVILEHTNQKLMIKDKLRPLLVSGIFGSGRVLYMGFNSTWRWRKISDDYFDRFWIQCIRYLLEGKLESGNEKRTLSFSKTKYGVDETIYIKAKLSDIFTSSLVPQQVKGKVFKGTTVVSEFVLQQEPNQEGHFEGEIKIHQQGEFRIVIEDSEAAKVLLEKKVKIEFPLIEYEKVEMNQAGLSVLSEKTGGEFYVLADVKKMLDALPANKETIIVNLPARSLWDSGRFFILIVMLLSMEWFMRKKYKLL